MQNALAQAFQGYDNFVPTSARVQKENNKNNNNNNNNKNNLLLFSFLRVACLLDYLFIFLLLAWFSFGLF